MWNAAAVIHAFLVGVFAVARPEDGTDFWIPIAFLVSGALLFLWELSMPGFFIAVAAVPLVVLGVIGLTIPGFFTSGIIWPMLIGLIVVAPTMVVTLRVYRSLGPPDSAPTTMSADTLRGQEGTVTVPLDSETTKGKVRVQGTIWSAKCESGTVPEGTRVAIKEVRGVHLLVVPVQTASKAEAADAAAEQGAFEEGTT